MDGSFGPARALRAVWTARGHIWSAPHLRGASENLRCCRMDQLLTYIRPRVGRHRPPGPDGFRTRQPQQRYGLEDLYPRQAHGASVRPVLPSLHAHSEQLLAVLTARRKFDIASLRTLSFPAPCSSGLGRIVSIEGRFPGQYGPGGTSVLVRQGDRGDVGAPSPLNFDRPSAAPIRTSRRGAQSGSRALDEQEAQIPVAALADPQQPRTAPGGTLPWHDA